VVGAEFLGNNVCIAIVLTSENFKITLGQKLLRYNGSRSINGTEGLLLLHSNGFTLLSM
jgi:hypothetical protein